MITPPVIPNKPDYPPAPDKHTADRAETAILAPKLGHG